MDKVVKGSDAGGVRLLSPVGVHGCGERALKGINRRGEACGDEMQPGGRFGYGWGRATVLGDSLVGCRKPPGPRDCGVWRTHAPCARSPLIRCVGDSRDDVGRGGRSPFDIAKEVVRILVRFACAQKLVARIWANEKSPSLTCHPLVLCLFSTSTSAAMQYQRDLQLLGASQTLHLCFSKSALVASVLCLVRKWNGHRVALRWGPWRRHL